VRRIVVAVAATYFTAGAAASLYESYAAGTVLAGGVPLTVGGSISFTSSIVGGAAGGFAGGFVASGGNVKAGLEGALVGGVGAGVTAAEIGFAGTVALKSAIGCVANAANGGSCRRGALIAATASAAAQTFKDFAGPSASLTPGENMSVPNIPCGESGSNCYIPDPDLDGRIPLSSYGNNTIGLNQMLDGGADDASKQGGSLSVALNRIPGMNSVSQLHDSIFNRGLITGFSVLSNWGTMIPAAAFTYTAISDDYVPVAIYRKGKAIE